jgi:hypothetical protein
MTEAEFQDLLLHLDTLVSWFESHPDPEISAQALELIRHVDAMHREGIERLVGLISGRDPGLLDEVRRDPIVTLLLNLYELAAASPAAHAFIPLDRLAASAAAARARSRL